jgi:hypothetical protein
MLGPTETNPSRHHVFISYSHEDSAFLQPVVRLMRIGDEPVFFDIENLRAGSRWREQLDAALADARMLVVFWCLHSSRSPEVSREYQAAISAEKDVVPVLLDWTPLPAALAAFQWIDLRRLGRSEHSWFSGAKVSRYAVAIVLCASVLTGLSLWLGSGILKSPEYPGDAPVRPSSSVSPTSTPVAPTPVTTSTPNTILPPAPPELIPPQVTALLEVPDLKGKTRDQALTILADRGLVLGQVGSVLSNDTPDSVVYQQPAATSRVPPGTSVDVVLASVSSGPEAAPAAIPRYPLVWLLLLGGVLAGLAGALIAVKARGPRSPQPPRTTIPTPTPAAEKVTRRQRHAARILNREVASRLRAHD